MRIAFDIGGWISRYPEQSKTLAETLIRGGCAVVILTDMPLIVASSLLNLNDWLEGVHFHRIISVHADFAELAENAKPIACERERIDVLFDDYAPYLIGGGYVGLFVWPKAEAPWESPLWKTGREEARAFLVADVAP